jgi:hypothetical protein
MTYSDSEIERAQGRFLRAVIELAYAERRYDTMTGTNGPLIIKDRSLQLCLDNVSRIYNMKIGS